MNRRVHKVSGVFDLPTQTKYVHASRGRRPSHYVGDDREQAILATAERLLAQRPLGDFSVDDLAKGAGISRPTFYFYFPSKNAVLLSLLDQMNTKARAALKALDGKRSGDPAAVWRARIEAFFEVSGSHRAVAVAGAAAKATNPDVRQLWSMLMQGWISYTTGAIKAERGRGAAPDTVPPEDLALALNMLSERVMAATFTDEEPAIPEERVIDTLLAHLAGQHLPPLTVTPQRTSRGVEGPAHRRESARSRSIRRRRRASSSHSSATRRPARSSPARAATRAGQRQEAAAAGLRGAARRDRVQDDGRHAAHCAPSAITGSDLTKPARRPHSKMCFEYAVSAIDALIDHTVDGPEIGC